jgi:3-oxoadipate CoA-transferase beta subunit
VSTVKPLDRRQMAQQVAQDIPEGWHVNLGIGAPTEVADYIPADREVLIHSENGILGMGSRPQPAMIDPWLVNAGKIPVTLKQGASLFHHADSFLMIRGGHIDLCVLGAFQVAENGDLANWSTDGADRAPAVGGAMDLAVGAKRVWVLMEHTTKAGHARLVRRCTYPLTALGVVSRVYTNFAVLVVTPTGFQVRSMAQGMSFEELQSITDANLVPCS